MEDYSRGQIEQALWPYFQSRTKDNVFKTRTKRLLEIDARDAPTNKTECTFVSENKGHKGTDRVFKIHDCFILGLGHELLDAGFKQSEVVFLLQHTREHLINVCSRLSEYPNTHKHDVLPEDYPKLPTMFDPDRKLHLVDMRVFFTFEKFNAPTDKNSKALFRQPVTCYGLKALTEEINDHSYSRMKMTIIEIAALFIEVRKNLENSKIIKRGRSKKA